jgi:hypothetical protein
MNNDFPLRGKRVLIFQQRGWGKTIGRFLARHLYDEGCRLAALTSKLTTHRAIVNQTDAVYDVIESHDLILANPKKYLAGDHFPLADICRGLGVSSLWPLLSASRMLAKSYEKKYYYAFERNVSDEYFVDYAQAVWKCIQKIFTEFKPDLILAPNFASGHHLMFYHYAKQQGIKMVTVTDSKIRGQLLFSESPEDNEGSFFEYLDAANAGQLIIPDTARTKARQYINEFRQQFKQPTYALGEAKLNWRQKIWQVISPWKQAVLWYFRQPANFIPGVGITIDYRPPHIILRDYFADRYNRREVNHLPYYPFAQVGKFVYLPLQFQPESAIDVVAPHFSNQIETARQIAMTLPDDYTLVVKEHPAMIGLRRPSYLKKLLGTPNIKLIDYRTPTPEVLSRASLIIGTNGTTLAEAAFYRIPAIQLGNLGTTLRLPNVWPHTDLTTLSEKIKTVLAANLHTTQYELKLENYVAAAYATGFDLDYSGIWQQGKRDKLDNLWELYREETLKRARK